MMRIGCLLGSHFEDSEFRVPYDRFRGAGHQVTILGRKRGEHVTGYKGREHALIELGIDEAQPRDYDALFIPGGYSPDHLRADAKIVELTKAFEGRPIFAICHGPQLLITAGMVRGRKMTAWPTIQVDLKNAGAEVVDAEVVIDDKLVTSRKPQDLDAFTTAALDVLSAGAPAHR